jgi:hypothetical protein
LGSIENETGLIAMYLLNLIGVTGEPVDPRLNYDELGHADPAFLPGAVQPMTIRNMLTLIINALPGAELQVLTAVLDVATNPDYAETDDQNLLLQKRKAQNMLMQLTSARFDSYPDAPFYYIHLNAAQRRIREDVENYVRRWKQLRGIPERRTHVSGFDEYLRVWDMHEGWKNGTYEHDAENSFSSIEAVLNKPKSTVVGAYRAAFKRITGHEFSPEMWMRVFGSVGLATADGDSHPAILRRYRSFVLSNKPKPVPEATLQHQDVEHGRVGLVEGATAVEGGQATVELEIDMLGLLRLGWTDDRIAEELDVSPSVVGYFRGRLEEMENVG